MDTPRAYTFTVFTATYNRAHTLPRVFESLQRQTFRDFEWLIVDDGSTDHTPQLVGRFQTEGRFPIRYVQQPENRGKHVAFNRGVREATGELFLTLDSDDGCVPEALERFKFHWDSIPAERRHGFSGVTSLCMDEQGCVVGDRFPKDSMDSDSLELQYKFKVKGEKWGFQRTSVLRDCPFPEPPGVRYVSESVVWLALARRYRTRFVNERLRIYYGDSPGAERMASLTIATVRGRRISHQVVLNDYRDVRYISLAMRARSAINYGRYSFLCGLGMGAQVREIHALATKALVVLCAPAALLMSLRDRLEGVAGLGSPVRPGDPSPANRSRPPVGQKPL